MMRYKFDVSMHINKIDDQEAGCVSTSVTTLDELPLLKSSIRQDLLKNTKKLRENLLDLSNIANDKLEGWLEESPWEEIIDNEKYEPRHQKELNNYNNSKSIDKDFDYDESQEEDPWV